MQSRAARAFQRFVLICLISVAMLPGSWAQDKGVFFDSLGIVAAGAKLNKISDQFGFTEGPAVDRSGNIYFTDQPNDRIWIFDTEGHLRLFLDSTGRSNGLYFDPAGNLVACADLRDELWSIGPDKKIRVLLRNYRGKRFNGPNDLWIDKQGGIYFTDPYYQRPYWKRQKPDMPAQRIYYLPARGKKARMLSGALLKPNGIVGSPDGQFLFVADIGAGKTYRFRIIAPGKLGPPELFVQQGADGITLDSAGNLYLAGEGVTVYDSRGIRIAHFPVPAEWTANLCFGGTDRRTLFLTAGNSVYTLRMNTRGVE